MLRGLLLHTHLTHLQAALYATLAYFLFAMSDGMGKYLMSDGFEKSQVLVATSIPSFIILTLLMIKRRGIKRAYYTPYKFWHVMRALSLVAITFFVFEALKTLPMADFYGIVFASPLLVTIGAFLFFKESTSLSEWIAIAIGFAVCWLLHNPIIIILTLDIFMRF